MSSFDMSSDQGFQTEAVVKWFNLTKGFGFVAPADGSSDAFLHSSVVSRAGMREVAEGTKMLVTISDGPKGRQVISILEVRGMADVMPHQGGYSQGFGGAPSHRAPPEGPEVEMTGTVKWFKPDKGFGFVTPDDGGRDIFVHRSVLASAGLQEVDSGQKVSLGVKTASKGREATWIRLS